MADVKKYVDVLNKLIRRCVDAIISFYVPATNPAIATSTFRGLLNRLLSNRYFNTSTDGPMSTVKSLPSRPRS